MKSDMTRFPRTEPIPTYGDKVCNRAVSSILRIGDDARLVLEELTQIFNPRGGDWIESEYMPSLPAVIDMRFEEHLRSIGLITTEAADDHAAAHVDPLIPASETWF